MQWLKRFFVLRLFFAAFGALTAVVAIMAVFTVRQINGIESGYDRLMNGPLQRNTFISDATREMKAIRLYMLTMGYADGDQETIQDNYARYQEAAALFITYTDAYYTNMDDDRFLQDAEKTAYKAEIMTIRDLFTDSFSLHVAEAYRAATKGDAVRMRMLIMEGIPTGDQITERLGVLRETVQQTAQHMSAETQAMIHHSKIMVLVIAACMLSIVLFVSISMLRLILKSENIRSEKAEQQQRHEAELRDAAQAATEASRMKSAFLANMSHEIRTPMNGILGFAELALGDNIPSKTKDYLKKIKTSSESLMQIINDILDISKIEAGKVVLEHMPFDLHEVFRLCRTVIMPKAMEKGVTLFCYAEPSIDKMMMGDPLRLRQALLNLLSNAVKFTNTGMVKLLSAITETGEDSVTIHFEVKDNGIGMTAEQVQKIFNPFVQADESTTRKYGGTGLGLSITKNIIEMMGGALHVESTLGLGSKFSFELTFPTIAMPAESITNDHISQPIAKPNFTGEVLVCEDNELNQQVISDNLTRIGLNVTIAANGHEGVAYVQRRMDEGSRPFDLVFMDIHMPVMDGLDAARMLKEIGCQTPVIALTANVMPNDMDTYRTLGMMDCVPKPFRIQELWACLLKYLKPVSMSNTDVAEQAEISERQHLMLVSSFVKDHQNTYTAINDAIRVGDIKTAHRIAHTLKGVAGLIGMTMLQEAARVVEQSLAKGRAEYTHEQMDVLDYELRAALMELTPQVSKSKNEKPPKGTVDPAAFSALLDQLDVLLEADSFDCVNMIDALEAIPGTEMIIGHLEKFAFKQAREALAILRAERSS